jgi:hypothetical protein
MPEAVMDHEGIVQELRSLILDSAPDPAEALAVEDCDADRLLDEIIPFSSLIVLGTVVAVEDRFDIRVTNRVLRQATEGGVTLTRLATLIQGLAS